VDENCHLNEIGDYLKNNRPMVNRYEARTILSDHKTPNNNKVRNTRFDRSNNIEAGFR
jgi:hypothetical protein